jgi:hypothetical protein
MAKCVSVYYEVCCVGVKIAELEIRKETSCLQRNDYSLRVLLSQDRPWFAPQPHFTPEKLKKQKNSQQARGGHGKPLNFHKSSAWQT